MISPVIMAAMGAKNIVFIVLIVLMIVALMVMPMFTNKKRKKQIEELHNSIAVGDTVKTVGGIVGKVVAINEISPVDKEFVLETGLDGRKATMVFDFNALYQVMNRVPRTTVAPKVEDIAPAAEAKEEKVEAKAEPVEATETTEENK